MVRLHRRRLSVWIVHGKRFERLKFERNEQRKMAKSFHFVNEKMFKPKTTTSFRIRFQFYFAINSSIMYNWMNWTNLQTATRKIRFVFLVMREATVWILELRIHLNNWSTKRDSVAHTIYSFQEIKWKHSHSTRSTGSSVTSKKSFFFFRKNK